MAYKIKQFSSTAAVPDLDKQRKMQEQHDFQRPDQDIDNNRNNNYENV